MDKMTETAIHCDCRDAWDCSTILEEYISCYLVTTGSTKSAKPALPLCLAVLRRVDSEHSSQNLTAGNCVMSGN